MSAAGRLDLRGLAAVALGGSAGTAARMGVLAGAASLPGVPTILPLACINALGGLLAGAIVARRRPDAGRAATLWFLALVPGFCGGFTTFSSLAGQAHDLLRGGAPTSALTALVLGLMIGLAAGRGGRLAVSPKGRLAAVRAGPPTPPA